MVMRPRSPWGPWQPEPQMVRPAMTTKTAMEAMASTWSGWTAPGRRCPRVSMRSWGFMAARTTARPKRLAGDMSSMVA